MIQIGALQDGSLWIPTKNQSLQSSRLAGLFVIRSEVQQDFVYVDMSDMWKICMESQQKNQHDFHILVCFNIKKKNHVIFAWVTCQQSSVFKTAPIIFFTAQKMDRIREKIICSKFPPTSFHLHSTTFATFLKCFFESCDSDVQGLKETGGKKEERVIFFWLHKLIWWFGVIQDFRITEIPNWI